MKITRFPRIINFYCIDRLTNYKPHDFEQKVKNAGN